MSLTIADDPSRAKRLKALTHEIHDGVDRSIMSVATFADLSKYRRFLSVQHGFHRIIAPLYRDPRLKALIPGLASRARFGLVEADLADLGDATGDAGDSVAADGAPDMPTALGWLYVAEGSNMGAALLRKEAARLGLSDDHGARHLAPAPEGPAAHWRAFTAALDAVELSAADEERVRQGAVAAFACVQSLIDEHIA